MEGLPAKSFAVSIIIFLLSGICMLLLTARTDPTVVSTNLENIPIQLNGYAAVEDSFPEAVYTELNADKHVYRHYRLPAGKQIDLYIGYYGTAKGGRTPHNPYACLPSQGWLILDAGKVSIATKRFPEGVWVNYMLSKQNDSYKYILHWYQSAGTRILDTGIKQNLHRFLGRILHNRNDGAYVQLAQTSSRSELDKTRDSVASLTAAIMDLLPEYWPSEQ